MNINEEKLITKKAICAIYGNECATFSKELIRHMKNKGITNEGLAEELGCSAKTIQRMRNGNSEYNLKYVVAACVFLNCRPQVVIECWNWQALS